ncbi:MAG: biofilm PGA synthesis protein PgaB, partial [Planctomycetaceae bacterium]|nr:biofilm PGA synthesis protein PgaB [Planctomycetaceae bacterium]
MRLLCTFILLFLSSVVSSAPIKVAVFEGDGVGKSCTNLLTVLDNSSKIQFEVSRVTTADILAGKLDAFDVLIHPGGSGSKQGNDLGEDGRQQVRQFVSQGGGFLGVCAGAYLATNDYTWSLNLIDAKVVDRKHWARGTGTVQLELSPSGQDLFKAKS